MLRPPPDDAAAVVEVDAKGDDVGLLGDVGGDEVLDRVEVMLVLNVDDAKGDDVGLLWDVGDDDVLDRAEVMLVLNVDDADDVLLELELGEVEEETTGAVMLML
jgi:hypothetical protein